MSEVNDHPIGKGNITHDREYLYDLIAIDIDGTLLNSQSKLSGATAPLIRETQATGIGITLVSGRPKLKMLPLMNELGLSLPYIGSGGAYIADPSDQRVIYNQTLTEKEVVSIVGLARIVNSPIISQASDHLFYEGPLEELEQLIAHAKIDIVGVGDTKVAIVPVDDVVQACANPAKITVFGSPAALFEIENVLGQRKPPLYITYSGPTYLEITQAGVNKGEALKRLTTYLAIPLERVLAIGDSKNDISMFQIAGMAVAMGNAPAEVKAEAQYIAPSNDEDGVAWILSELVLKKHGMNGRHS
jgi:Cof subfamily protein (haloacid dehalogenase superfamily)